jgi:hypothetical protein
MRKGDVCAHADRRMCACAHVRLDHYSFATRARVGPLQADAISGRVKEAFACGTAAVVTAIGEVRHAAGEFKIGDGGEGPVTQRIRITLTGIQRGRIADAFGWIHQVS